MVSILISMLCYASPPYNPITVESDKSELNGALTCSNK